MVRAVSGTSTLSSTPILMASSMQRSNGCGAAPAKLLMDWSSSPAMESEVDHPGPPFASDSRTSMSTKMIFDYLGVVLPLVTEDALVAPELFKLSMQPVRILTVGVFRESMKRSV